MAHERACFLHFILDAAAWDRYSEDIMALSGKIINNRYRLFEKLCITDFAEYYKAFDRETGNDAVFAYYNQNASSRRAEDVFRFRLDAKKILSRHHPNCACPYEVSTLFDICYQVMPFFEGPLFSELISIARSISYTQLLFFTHNIADALMFLHACGITHLGLDPSHIILFNEKPLIIDVGSSHLKIFSSEELLASRLDYISPEETGMISASPDPRSDLFSLGAILFRLMTGEAVFRGPRITATLHNIISRNPDFRILEKHGFPAEFTAVIKRLLAKEPAERYQSAEALRVHLDSIISGTHDYHEASCNHRSLSVPFEEQSESFNALYVYDKAQTLLKKIVELTPSRDGKTSDDALREIAHIHLITGNYDETLRICQQVYSRTEDTYLKADIIALESAAYFRKNEWQKSIDDAVEGLRLFGEKFPKSGVRLWLRCGWEALMFFIGFIMPAQLVGSSKKIETYKSILSIYKTLIEAFMFRNMGPEFLFASLRMNVLARGKPNRSKESGISIIGIALVCAALGFIAISEKLLSRALEISLSVNDRWGEAYALGFLGLICEFSGKYQKGIAHYYPASMRTFTEIGDIKNIGIIHIGLVQSYLHISEYEKALSHNEQSHRIALRMDDSFFTGMSLVYFARIFREKGEFEKAKEYAEEAIQFNRKKNLQQNLCAALIERGCLFIEASDYTNAIPLLEEARRLNKAGYFSPQHVNHLYAHLAEAYSKAYIATATGSAHTNKNLLRKAITFANIGMLKSRHWPSLKAKALRAKAFTAFACGNNRKAKRFFEKSIAHAQISGGRFDAALSFLEYALFLLQRGENIKSRECMEQACDIFSAISSKGYEEICSRLLGIKIDEGTSLNAAIQQIRQSIIKEAGLNLAAGITDAEKLNAMMNSIYEYLGAEKAFLFSINEKSPNPIFMYPNADDENKACMIIAAEEYLAAKSDNKVAREKCFQRIPEHYGAGKDFYFLPLGSNENPSGACAIISSLLPFLQENDLFILKDIMAHALVVYSKYCNTDFTRGCPSRRMEISNHIREKLERALAFIRENYQSDISREGLAAQADLSPNYFSALFAEYTGKKLNDFIIDLRIEKAAELLLSTDEKIIDIAYTSGFENLRTFNRAFKKKIGVTPKEYRKKIQ